MRYPLPLDALEHLLRMPFDAHAMNATFTLLPFTSTPATASLKRHLRVRGTPIAAVFRQHA
ncbi:hypothetical protein N5D48_17170 [Pseudomonas sp. GD03858]|uniref:hypothetical protein n=1 Tax=unclassified Pseudomonas TaxID=196821 RepID=UPI00244BEFA1|nr:MULTISPECIES: hypothetical protein [unclassified Pseudomonas]MDH0648630.1 hypothetical protein [Pseudomonas sp. GD03867]MDH0664139.1 hypothetical protein [Pseudomonas sp. GD03858]